MIAKRIDRKFMKFDWIKISPLINPVTRNGSASFFSTNTTARSLRNAGEDHLSSFYGEPTDIMRSRTKASRGVITFFVLLCALCRDIPVKAFFTSSPPLSRITATGSRCGKDGRPATGAKAAALTNPIAHGHDQIRGWRTHDMKRKGRNEGVGSLRAGLDFHAFSGPELVESFGKGIAAQSVKHHWQSGFTGGSVGVIGTLVAIQVRNEHSTRMPRLDIRIEKLQTALNNIGSYSCTSNTLKQVLHE